MKKRSMAILSSIFLCLTLFLSGCGAGQASDTQPATGGEKGGTHKFKMSYTVQTSHVWHAAAEKFKEELAARSNGRMTLDLYPASQLGPDKDMMAQLNAGSLDFAYIANAYMSGRSESLNGWFMPFLFPTLEDAAKARESEPAKEMLKELEQQGVIGLDYVFAGNRHVLVKEGTVQSPEDLKGKKLRTPASPAILDFWNTLGTSPAPIPISEVYTALQTGVIDGIDIDLDALVSFKFYEITKNLTLTNHITYPGIMLMSKATAGKLSSEDLQIVKDAAKVSTDWAVQEALNREQKLVEEAKANGVNVLDLPNDHQFGTMKEEFYQKYGEKNPLIKAFIEANKK